MKNNNVVGHGFFRKSKAYGLVCGVVLGLAFLGGHVSADEVTPQTTETATAVTATPTSVTDNTSDVTVAEPIETGDESDVSSVAVNDTELSQAVQSAQEAGVEVTQTEDQSYPTQEEAQADTSNQIADVTKKAAAQATINQTFSEAVTNAQEAGVTVTVKEDTKLADVEAAKTLLEEQVAKLAAAQKTQIQLDTALAQAIEAAKQAGVTITVTDKVTYTDLQTALADLNNQVTALQEAQQAQASANATVDEAIKEAVNNHTTVTKSGTVTVSTDEAATKAQEIKGQIEAVVSENQQIAAANAAEQARYEADKQKAEAHLKEDGYASELINQSLVFVQEPNAKHTVVKSDGTVVVTDSTEDTRVVLHQGETVTVTYTGLENSFYNHTKIAKVVYTYTAKDAVDSLHISTDPTVTVTFYGEDFATVGDDEEQTGSWSSHLGMSIQFFDASNQVITFTAEAPAALAFNSLNRTKVYAGSGYGETIQNLSSNIKVVTINGSSIVYDNGVLHASTYNDYKSNGSRYEANPVSGDPDFWDGDSQQKRWYGAAVGVVTSGDTISFDIVNEAGSDATNHEYGKYWFAFNSKVATEYVVPPTVTPFKTLEVPTIEVTAEAHPMTIETAVTKPVLTADVHNVSVAPTPEEPETPTPEAPQPTQEVPVVQASVLPMTGDETTPLNIIASLFGGLMAMLGLFGIRKRKED